MVLDDLEGGQERTGTVGQHELDEDDLAHAGVVDEVLDLLEALGDDLLLLLGRIDLDEQGVGVDRTVVVHADDVAARLGDDTRGGEEGARLVGHVGDVGLAHVFSWLSADAHTMIAQARTRVPGRHGRVTRGRLFLPRIRTAPAFDG